MAQRQGNANGKTETERERIAPAPAAGICRTCKRAHGTPPPDVAVKSTSIPQRIQPTPASSSCTSPGALCAELMS